MSMIQHQLAPTAPNNFGGMMQKQMQFGDLKFDKPDLSTKKLDFSTQKQAQDVFNSFKGVNQEQGYQGSHQRKQSFQAPEPESYNFYVMGPSDAPEAVIQDSQSQASQHYSYAQAQQMPHNTPPSSPREINEQVMTQMTRQERLDEAIEFMRKERLNEEVREAFEYRRLEDEDFTDMSSSDDSDSEVGVWGTSDVVLQPQAQAALRAHFARREIHEQIEINGRQAARREQIRRIMRQRALKRKVLTQLKEKTVIKREVLPVTPTGIPEWFANLQHSDRLRLDAEVKKANGELEPSRRSIMMATFEVSGPELDAAVRYLKGRMPVDPEPFRVHPEYENNQPIYLKHKVNEEITTLANKNMKDESIFDDNLLEPLLNPTPSRSSFSNGMRLRKTKSRMNKELHDVFRAKKLKQQVNQIFRSHGLKANVVLEIKQRGAAVRAKMRLHLELEQTLRSVRAKTAVLNEIKHRGRLHRVVQELKSRFRMMAVGTFDTECPTQLKWRCTLPRTVMNSRRKRSSKLRTFVRVNKAAVVGHVKQIGLKREVCLELRQRFATVDRKSRLCAEIIRNEIALLPAQLPPLPTHIPPLPALKDPLKMRLHAVITQRWLKGPRNVLPEATARHADVLERRIKDEFKIRLLALKVERKTREAALNNKLSNLRKKHDALKLQSTLPFPAVRNSPKFDQLAVRAQASAEFRLRENRLKGALNAYKAVIKQRRRLTVVLTQLREVVAEKEKARQLKQEQMEYAPPKIQKIRPRKSCKSYEHQLTPLWCDMGENPWTGGSDSECTSDGGESEDEDGNSYYNYKPTMVQIPPFKKETWARPPVAYIKESPATDAENDISFPLRQSSSGFRRLNWEQLHQTEKARRAEQFQTVKHQRVVEEIKQRARLARVVEEIRCNYFRTLFKLRNVSEWDPYVSMIVWHKQDFLRKRMHWELGRRTQKAQINLAVSQRGKAIRLKRHVNQIIKQAGLKIRLNAEVLCNNVTLQTPSTKIAQIDEDEFLLTDIWDNQMNSELYEDEPTGLDIDSWYKAKKEERKQRKRKAQANLLWGGLPPLKSATDPIKKSVTVARSHCIQDMRKSMYWKRQTCLIIAQGGRKAQVNREILAMAKQHRLRMEINQIIKQGGRKAQVTAEIRQRGHVAYLKQKINRGIIARRNILRMNKATMQFIKARKAKENCLCIIKQSGLKARLNVSIRSRKFRLRKTEEKSSRSILESLWNDLDKSEDGYVLDEEPYVAKYSPWADEEEKLPSFGECDLAQAFDDQPRPYGLEVDPHGIDVLKLVKRESEHLKINKLQQKQINCLKQEIAVAKADFLKLNARLLEDKHVLFEELEDLRHENDTLRSRLGQDRGFPFGLGRIRQEQVDLKQDVPKEQNDSSPDITFFV